ncbi:MAG: cytochrome C [Verrucomicrobia bacterium]|nr:cytochrome C [Verrucomicrobiota bacterium]
MPIYEFYSPDTNKVYSFFARSLAQGKNVPRCPDKPGARMERMVSRFAVTGRASEKKESPQDASDPRMERMMAEMQSEMAGMDESNPDPKALGRMMRKMTEATGQPMPKEMEQMIRRMEAGEDPEKLEEEFGDAFDGMDLPGEEKPDEPGAPRHSMRRPVRDPALYEMSEFI